MKLKKCGCRSYYYCKRNSNKEYFIEKNIRKITCKEKIKHINIFKGSISKKLL